MGLSRLWAERRGPPHRIVVVCIGKRMPLQPPRILILHLVAQTTMKDVALSRAAVSRAAALFFAVFSHVSIDDCLGAAESSVDCFAPAHPAQLSFFVWRGVTLLFSPLSVKPSTSARSIDVSNYHFDSVGPSGATAIGYIFIGSCATFHADTDWFKRGTVSVAAYVSGQERQRGPFQFARALAIDGRVVAHHICHNCSANQPFTSGHGRRHVVFDLVRRAIQTRAKLTTPTRTSGVVVGASFLALLVTPFLALLLLSITVEQVALVVTQLAFTSPIATISSR